MKVGALTGKALNDRGRESEAARYQEGDGFLNDMRLESFGHLLANYILNGAELTRDANNNKAFTLSEGVISFGDQLWRVYNSQFTTTHIGTTYHLGFLIGKGYIFVLSKPTSGYLPLWEVVTDGNGDIATLKDLRGKLNLIKYKAAYDGVYLNTQEALDAIQSIVEATDIAVELNATASQKLNAFNVASALSLSTFAVDSTAALKAMNIATANAVVITEQTELVKTATETERLATKDERTATGTERLATKLVKENTEAVRLATVAERLATVSEREQTNAVKLATEAERLATQSERNEVARVRTDTEETKRTTELVKKATESERLAIRQQQIDHEFKVDGKIVAVEQSVLTSKENSESAKETANVAKALSESADTRSKASNALSIESLNVANVSIIKSDAADKKSNESFALSKLAETKATESVNRANNIIANAGDSNAEVVDARLRIDGKVAPTLGGHIREISSKLESVERKLDGAPTGIKITHGLNDYPAVHAVVIDGFGVNGFGFGGFGGGERYASHNRVDYLDSNSLVVYIPERFDGAPTITSFGSVYTARFPNTDAYVELYIRGNS